MEGCVVGIGVQMNNVIGYWFQNMRYMADVQQVIALRMIRFARGGPGALHEATRMTTEKAAAIGEAQIAQAAAISDGESIAEVATRAAKPYRRRVRANLKRLRKPTRQGGKSRH
jgi:hypothetical protein